jgi:zinc/manganese transport system permease protein
MNPDASALLVLLGLPFMQRALLAGLLTGGLGGLLGSVAVLRQMAFFSDALGHASLLGLTLAVALGFNPTLVLLPFAVVFALVVNAVVRRSRLPVDALLNIIYSASLAIAVLALSRLPRQGPGLEALLFGDILGVTWLDLGLIAALLLVTVALLARHRRSQILLCLDEPLARSRGVDAERQQLLFVVLLALAVALAIKAVGVLLISAFIVMPACGARLVSRGFSGYVLLSSAIGAGGAVIGLLASGLFNLPSGPALVVVQLLGFVTALMVSAADRSGAAASASSPDRVG